MLHTTTVAILICTFLSLTYAVLTPDPLCGITKGCYPSTCPAGGCTDFFLSWEDDEEYINFKLVSAVSSTGTVWAAIGFSYDTNMANTSVVMCKSETMTVEIGYTSPVKYAYEALTTSSSLRNTAVTRVGSYLTCLFARIKEPTEQPTQIFPLNKNRLYLLSANGLTLDGGVPSQHIKRLASASPILFTITDESTTVPLTTADSSTSESTPVSMPDSTPVITSETTPFITPTPPIISGSTDLSQGNSMFYTCLAVALLLGK